MILVPLSSSKSQSFFSLLPTRTTTTTCNFLAVKWYPIQNRYANVTVDLYSSADFTRRHLSRSNLSVDLGTMLMHDFREYRPLFSNIPDNR